MRRIISLAFASAFLLVIGAVTADAQVDPAPAPVQEAGLAEVLSAPTVSLDASLAFTPFAHTAGDIIERASEKVGVDVSAQYHAHPRVRFFGSLSPDYAGAGSNLRDRVNWTARYGVRFLATRQLSIDAGLERALGNAQHRCGDARGTFGAIRWSRGAFSFTPVRVVGCLDRAFDPHAVMLPGATRLPDGVWLFDFASFGFRLDPGLF